MRPQKPAGLNADIFQSSIEDAKMIKISRERWFVTPRQLHDRFPSVPEMFFEIKCLSLLQRCYT
jgi:hypothetical protein